MLDVSALMDHPGMVPRPAPEIAPIFRSRSLLSILGELFLHPDEPRSIAELAQRVGVSRQTVTHEINHLEKARIVASERRGRLKLIRPNPELPYARELEALLLKTVGPAEVIRREIAPVAGIEAAYLFGSWAARYLGESGPAPRDVDLLVIGKPDLDALYAASRRAARLLGLDVDTVVRSAEEWKRSDDGFLAELRQRPLLPLDSHSV